MDVRLSNQARVQSILSTLDKMDVDREKKKRTKNITKSLVQQTLSSNKKSHASLALLKDSMMAPVNASMASMATGNVRSGRYSAFLSRTVTGDPVTMETKTFRSKRYGRNGQADGEIGHSGRDHDEPVEPERMSSADRDDGSVFLEDAPFKDVAYISTPSHERSDQRQLQPLKPTGSDKRNHSLTSLYGNESQHHQSKERVSQGNADRNKWQALAGIRPTNKSQLGRRKLSMGGLALTKMSSRRRSRNTSGSDTSISEGGEEDHVGTKGPMAAFSVINATVAFKRQRLKKIQERRKFRLSTLFKVVARLAVVIRRICEVHYVDNGGEEREALSFARMVSEQQRSDLMFDVTEYRAKKKWRLMPDTKRILQKHPDTRTEQDQQHIEMALRDVSSLGEYPVAMQRSIARVGWYESYSSNRVIVREGQSPEAFYFILSGSALVSLSVPGEVKPRILAILLRGDSFGELAILNQGKRTATVTSRESVEMFAISAQDFTQIVMSGNSEMLRDPRTSAFMRSVDFLKEWPLKNIENNPKKCVFNFFRKDTVLVRDSKLSEWIYIIKSGSCSVFKQLKYVEPKIHPEGKRTTKADEPRMTASRHNMCLIERERSLINRRIAAAHAQRESLYKRGMDLPILMMNDELTQGIAPQMRRSGTILSNEDTKEDIEEDKREERWIEELEENGEMRVMSDRLHPLIESDLENIDEDTPRYGPQRTFADDLNRRVQTKLKNGKKKGFPITDHVEEANDRHVFVSIQTLHRGGVFGLVDVLFSEQPSLSLVSNGAECMVMSKQFFLQHATEDMLHRIKISMMPFAKEDEIQRSLENQLKWEAYRSVTMRQTVRRLQLKKSYAK